MSLEELQQQLGPYRRRLAEMEGALDVPSQQAKIAALEEQTAQPGFWDNASQTQGVLQQIKALRNKIGAFAALQGQFDDAATLVALGLEENDASVAAEAAGLVGDFISSYENLRTATLLSGEYDANNAIVTLHSGAGGTESCDWVLLLFRMYAKWAEKRGFAFEVLDQLDGEEAGLKSVTFQINGENTFGYVKSEKGVHRLVRISPFDTAGRRHTSFASCDIMPELDDSVAVDINPDDLKIDTYRASGRVAST